MSWSLKANPSFIYLFLFYVAFDETKLFQKYKIYKYIFVCVYVYVYIHLIFLLYVIFILFPFIFNWESNAFSHFELILKCEVLTSKMCIRKKKNIFYIYVMSYVTQKYILACQREY